MSVAYKAGLADALQDLWAIYLGAFRGGVKQADL